MQSDNSFRMVRAALRQGKPAIQNGVPLQSEFSNNRLENSVLLSKRLPN
jgi:hypothetical protein